MTLPNERIREKLPGASRTDVPRTAPRVATRLLLVLALLCSAPACRWITPVRRNSPAPAPTVEPLAPSPRLIVGRIIAIDAARRFAFVELAPDAPMAATGEGTELVARTLDLHETARLRASAYLRGRTLGTTITSGQPSTADEVVWLAP